MDMNYIISHSSALEYWRRQRRLGAGSGAEVGARLGAGSGAGLGAGLGAGSGADLGAGSGSGAAARVNIPPSAPPNKKFVADAGNLGLTMPLNILVADAPARKVNKLVVSHVCRVSLPKGCFFDAGNSLLASSPELCFLQMAGDMPLLKLIELGFELCGTYSMPAGADDEAVGATMQLDAPLTTVAKLQSLALKMEGTHGRKNALQALRYVVENSASPMETLLAMLLFLPYNLGGYGLAKPLLNKRVDVGKTAKKAIDKSYYRCDLYWPVAKLGIEYDSDTYHTGAARIAEDAKRRNALAYLGIQSLTITKQQLYNRSEFDKVVHQISKQLGKRLRCNNPNFAKKQLALRALLPVLASQ
ncbi:MAG: hypothetical protein LBS98_05450 [Coriobacteriales bacterium]|nr:hypothetical protein [Coriobacteriales bacterium]